MFSEHKQSQLKWRRIDWSTYVTELPTGASIVATRTRRGWEGQTVVRGALYHATGGDVAELAEKLAIFSGGKSHV